MRRAILSLSVFAVCATAAAARPVALWPYEKLHQEADVVVLARAVKSLDTGDPLPDNPWPTIEFLSKETTFETLAVLKGAKVEKLVLVHYRLKDGNIPPNGPMLVAFRTVEEAAKANQYAAAPEYLLFLKRGADGRYEPVTGQIDSVLSVRSVGPGWAK